jgi:hypothetical protein
LCPRRRNRPRHGFDSLWAPEAAFAGANCGNGPCELSDEGESPVVDTVGQPLVSNEATVLGISQVDFVEPAAAAFKNGSGQWSMVVASNQLGGTGNYAFGCTNDTYNTYCNWNLTAGAGTPAGDPSLLFDGFFLHKFEINLQGNSYSGLLHGYTGNPCPSGCATPTWSWSVIQPGVALDFPNVAQGGGKVWAVANTIVSPAQLVMIRMDSQTTSTPYTNPCDPTNKTQFAAMEAGDDGFLHVVYYDLTYNLVRTIKFNMASPGWWCSTRKTIGPWSPATGSGPGCDRKTYVGFQSSNIRQTLGATIAIDTSANPDTLVVAYSTDQTPPSSCSGKTEARIYRSTTNGDSWSLAFVSGCQTALQAKVKAACTPTAGCRTGFFQVLTAYDADQSNPSNPGVGGLRYQSTDGGVTWGNVAISLQRALVPLAGVNSACFWGDYLAVASDRTHGSFFHAWLDSNIGPKWVIRGRAIDE